MEEKKAIVTTHCRLRMLKRSSVHRHDSVRVIKVTSLLITGCEVLIVANRVAIPIEESRDVWVTSARNECNPMVTAERASSVFAMKHFIP
jgi:hypothetical protein